MANRGMTMSSSNSNSMNDSMSSWRDGDVYFWHYKNPRMSGWCCAHKAVVLSGRLLDVYWTFLGRLPEVPRFCGENSWNKEEAIDILNLEYKGNLDEFERTFSGYLQYYDDVNVIDMRHANSQSCPGLIRRGALRSREMMLEVAGHMLEREESRIRMATFNVERLKEQRDRILHGDLASLNLINL